MGKLAAGLFIQLKTAIDNPVGAEITLHGGRIIQCGLADTPCGTSVEVRDLFLNVPARRKFLKSAATEESRIANVITYNYALANPSITFTLTKDGQENIHFSPVNTLRERAVSCWGDEFVSGLIEVNGEADEIRLRGFISSPLALHTLHTMLEGFSASNLHFFVNGRYVRDRVLMRALKESYQGRIPTGNLPAAILFIELSPKMVNVNVHPSKTEVRFAQPEFIHDLVCNTIRAVL